jgi:hypothetical protein
VGFVAIDGQILDEDVADAGALEQGEIGGDVRNLGKMESFFEAAGAPLPRIWMPPGEVWPATVK